MTDKDEDTLKTLKKLGVRSASFGVHGIDHVEFFPSSEDIKERPKAETEADEKVNPETGLTRRQSRDVLNMDE